MFCKNCGTQLPEGANICPSCGVPAGAGMNFCPQCHTAVQPNANVCTQCGYHLKNNIPYQQPYTPPYPGQKSSIVAGVLGILVGALGVHNFYLGYTTKAVIQLLMTVLSFLTCGITAIAASIWGLVEGILILTGNIPNDGNGNPLSRS